MSATGVHVPRRSVPRLFIVSVVCAILIWMPSVGCTQNVLGWDSVLSPFVFVPALHGEFKVSLIRVGVYRGTEHIPSQNIHRDLRQHFRMVSENIFADVMAGARVGRFGFRVHADTREFVGVDLFQQNPIFPGAVARLEFSGIRLGADLDVFQWMGLRAGLNTDYCLYRPLFSESIFTAGGGKQIVGELPITAGFHIFFEPPVNLYGFTAVFEAWCRWPVAGAELTDKEFSGGIRGLETVLGSMALKVGYRDTTVEFSDLQQFNILKVPVNFDASFSGWFLELAYYY